MHNLKQYVFTISATMGLANYIVIGPSSEAASSEVQGYFARDPKFKIHTVKTFNRYQNK